MRERVQAMARYESYRDSGVEYLGKVPETWSIEKGKWLFVKAERPVRDDDDVVTCFRDGQVTLRKNRRTEGFTNAIQEHGYQGIRKGDLVIHAMDAFAGAIGVSDSDGKSSPVYSACVPREKDVSNQYYYAYYLRDLALSGFIESLAKGIRERSTDFRYKDFSVLRLPVPDRETQTAIATYLDRKTAQIDQAVAIKEQQIALLKERKQILIQNAVTRGLNPDAPMRDSGVEWIGEVPGHWILRANRSLFTERVEPGREDLPLLSVSIHSAVSSEEIDEEENIRGRVKIEDRSKYNLVKPNDIVFNMMRAWQGAIGAVRVTGMVSPAYIIAIPNDELNAQYFEYQYRCPEFIQQMDRNSKGITDFRKRLYWSEFKQLVTVVPPLEEQAAIVTHIETESAKIDKAIALQQQQIERLKEYKATLINSAVTGKIKVPGVDEVKGAEVAA